MRDSCDTRLVSIVITTHNRSGVLPRAIDSALAQTYPWIEVIVVDDGSTDDTDAVMARYVGADPRVVYVRHEQCKGGNAARNSGIRTAQGYFIAGLDDDDEFLPNRVAMLVAAHSDSFAFIASRSLQISALRSVKTVYFPYVDLSMLLWENVVGNQVLIRRSVLIQAGLFDEDLVRYQDHDMWLRVLTQFGVARILPEVTQIIHYEAHGNSAERSRRDFVGAFAFYRRHKARFSPIQRRRYLMRLRALRIGANGEVNGLWSRACVRGALWALSLRLIVRVKASALGKRVVQVRCA